MKFFHLFAGFSQSLFVHQIPLSFNDIKDLQRLALHTLKISALCALQYSIEFYYFSTEILNH